MGGFKCYGKSLPRKRALARIDVLYTSLVGHALPTGPLPNIKQILLLKKSKNRPSFLRLLLKRPDVMDELTLKLTYNTNRIEGSTLNEDETADILFRNRTLRNHSLTEQLEAKNHQTAWRFLIDHLAAKTGINEALILRLHAILMNGIRDDAGFYRRHGVRIVGSNVATANHLKIDERMKKLIEKIPFVHGDLPEHTAKIHAEFEQIHPFSDGNGRIGRLLIQAMLLEKNYPPALILEKKRKIYIKTLNTAQRQGNAEGLTDFLCDAMLEGLNILEG